MDFQAFKWKSEVPVGAAIAADWNQTIITPIAQIDESLLAVADKLDETYCNGGTQLAQFAIEAPASVRWAMSHDRWNEFHFFDRFFRTEVVVAALTDLIPVKQTVNDFKFITTPELIETLARQIQAVGAYSDPTCQHEAARLSNRFVQGALEFRFPAHSAWINWKPWSEWHYDVAWDMTILVFDKRRGVATILITTDTD